VVSTERLADAATTASISLATISWLGVINEVVQIVAGMLAIVSGTCAAVYYIRKTVDQGELMRKWRKDSSED
jgi:hypothetical protein